jgi:hypothetical protein
MEKYLDLKNPQRTIFSFLSFGRNSIPFIPFHTSLFAFRIHLKCRQANNEGEKRKREKRDLKRSDWRSFFFPILFLAVKLHAFLVSTSGSAPLAQKRREG